MTSTEMVQIDRRWMAVIVTLLLQSAGVIWWAASINRDVNSLHATDGRHEETMEQLRLEALGREGRLRVVEQGAGRMETKLETIAEGIDRLNAQIDRLVESQP